MSPQHNSLSHMQPRDRANKGGHVFIVSAPSGSGKTTLCKALMSRMPDLLYSVSSTTRMPRNGEQDGVDYHFLSKEEFEKGIKEKKWAEYAEVHGNYYGTSAKVLDRALLLGQDILLDIDVQGAEQVLKQYPESVTIFIMPPSMEILRQRLEKRGTDSSGVIERRLKDAEMELERKDMYRHVIVNDVLEKATEAFISVVKQYQ